MSDATTYYACVESVDDAGNTSGYVVSAGTVTIDTTTPGAPSGIAFSAPFSSTTSLAITFTEGIAVHIIKPYKKPDIELFIFLKYISRHKHYASSNVLIPTLFSSV